MSSPRYPIAAPRVLYALALLAALLTLGGCKPRVHDSVHPDARSVVAYVSLDEPYARPVLDAFTRETGIQVHVVFDTEANKSRGLAQRLLAEKDRPRADVFWSSEVIQMLADRRGGALEPYRSPFAAGIPDRYKDPEGYWTGFAARIRVLLYNKQRVKSPPRSLLDLARPEWRNETAMANPLFGSTMTEAAALFQVLGPDKARAYYRKRKENGTHVVDGNSVAAEEAARGNVSVAQTDTDDAYLRVEEGRPVQVVFPDQDGFGALVMPNTAALVHGAPHRELGKQLLDFLLRPETELLLAAQGSRQLPLHPGLEARLPEKVRPLARVKAMRVDYARLMDQYDALDAFLRDTFLR